MKPVILIPAFQPSDALIQLVEELLRHPIGPILVVDDGSSADRKLIFDKLRKLPEKVTVLEHAVNMGKGAALKTGFNYILLNLPETPCIITADADGQHKAADILKVARQGAAKPGALVMGSRSFAGYVPFRSRFGNGLTKKVFWFFSGLSLNDTQSGLRSIPLALARRMMAIPSNGYEFEMEMLVNLRRWNIPVEEIAVETIYETGNTSSHFNPFKDSMRIYFVFLRYTLSSLVSFAVDYVLFLAFFAILGSVYYATYIARAISMIVNFNLNKKAVFKSGGKVAASFAGYLVLAVLSAVASAVLTNTLFRYFKIPLPVAKILSDSFLYFVNFAIQREIIFRHGVEEFDPGV